MMTNQGCSASGKRKPQVNQQIRFVFLVCAILTATPSYALEYAKLDTIRDTIRQFVVTELGGANADTKIVVKALDPRLRLAKCQDDMEVYLTPGTKLLGHSTVGVRCSSPNPWALFVPVHIEQLVPIITAGGSIRRGQVLNGDMLIVTKRSSTRLPGNYLKTSDRIIGRVATREIVAGSILTQSMFKLRKLVKRGQRVTLSMKTGAIAVRVAGVAMADGTRGERIKVKNLSSKRIVDGTVSDENLILVSGSAIR